MSSPCVKHLLEELRHFKWLWLEYRTYARKSVYLLGQADLRDIENGSRELFRLEKCLESLERIDSDDYRDIVAEIYEKESR